jgi:hypothetical protein
MATASPATPAPSLFKPAVATATAVLILASCLLNLTSQSPFNIVVVMVLSAAVTAVCAIAEWVRYFRRYIDYQIERRIGPPRDNPP